MKLSIEEKAKAYDIALDKIKMLLGTSSSCSREELEYVFSELKESEDERIRKTLISQYQGDGCLCNFGNRILYKDIRAWLEKQGLENDIKEDAIHPCNELIDTINKQCEQKPTDRVEPKFKVGDWVVDKDGIVKQILSYKDGVYKHTDGYSATIFEDEWRMWDTTKDAKDGDVLNSPSYRLIWIYKDNGHYHTCVNINYATGNTAVNGQIVIPKDACPATKDEQTILFAKMKEAGYEWNAEKKELKKIVAPIFHIGDTIAKKHNSDIHDFGSFIITDITGGKYWYNDRIICDITEQDEWELYEPVRQNSTAWSEEDETVLHNACEFIRHRMSGFGGSNGSIGGMDYRVLYEKLKSLKDRYTWKPSDRELGAILVAIGDERQKGSDVAKELLKIYQQLKKLREE